MVSRSKQRNPTITSAFVLRSTSTVAQAICHELARRGCRRFHLVARNDAANAQLGLDLRNRFGAVVSEQRTDLVADSSLSAQRPQIAEDFALYLITAGSLGDPELARENASEALAITAANYTGLLPWLTAIATPERLSRPGKPWVFSSVAADRGRPSNSIYGAAKAALTVFREGLLLRCHGGPFAVRVIKAGFMATPMTEGKAPVAPCASPESIARALLKIPNQRGIVYLPGWWRALMAVIRSLPPALATKT
jgi:short-subunit dehydrogenase